MGRKNYDHLIGVKKSRLTITNYNTGLEGDKKRTFLMCRCECGKERRLTLNDFKKKEILSCGCLKLELIAKQNYIDGRKQHSEYQTYKAMLYRCFKPDNKYYKDYGGRGITVCERWLKDFHVFLSDMGKCPKGLTVERINNDGNYEPDNCKWATRKEQRQNQRPRTKKKKQL